SALLSIPFSTFLSLFTYFFHITIFSVSVIAPTKACHYRLLRCCSSIIKAYLRFNKKAVFFY
ncbi:hypothetical protein, partial [Pectinatus cerevisiiphilus]|uniref:hypothetical protein n=1 Tax=Pectinatus cerevisiiphilus TaxID=86956 RepID=UPI001A9CDFA4